MPIVVNDGDGSALRKTTGGDALGSCARTVATLAPSCGAAKMIPSTRWAMRNSTTGAMSTVSMLSISLSSRPYPAACDSSVIPLSVWATPK